MKPTTFASFVSSVAGEQQPRSGRLMKKTEQERRESEETDMLPEYNLTGKKGVRGKYYRAYRQGHTVRVLKEDGTTSLSYFTLEDGAVMLEPDVRAYFPDSQAVNAALRGLIKLVPQRKGSSRYPKARASD
jgi:hypothetical protein